MIRWRQVASRNCRHGFRRRLRNVDGAFRSIEQSYGNQRRTYQYKTAQHNARPALHWQPPGQHKRTQQSDGQNAENNADLAEQQSRDPVR